MQPNLNNLNMHKYGADVGERTIKDGKEPSFTGLREKMGGAAIDTLDIVRKKYKDELLIAAGETLAEKKGGLSGLFSAIASRGIRFIKENFTDGVDVTYKNRSEILKSLKKNFGESFEDCLKDIDDYNVIVSSQRDNKISNFIGRAFKISRGKKDKFVYTKDPYDDLITFHKDPFIKNVCHGIKEFTIGTALDLCISARNLSRRLDAKYGKSHIVASTAKSNSFFNNVLDRRIAEKKARDAFYKVSGVFEKATEGLDVSSHLCPIRGEEAIKEATKKAINENIAKLAKSSINAASKKVGKYNTKTERAWNRLGTGLVSATFAATEYHNISMYQNNDEKKAKEAGKERFWMDMERQGITASLTYVLLGALQGKVNSSMMYAALSLGGITMFSEIAMRLRRHKSLTPLTPEQARLKAEKQEGTAPKKDTTKDNKELNTSAILQTNNLAPKDNIFTQFNNQTPSILENSPAFGAGESKENEVEKLNKKGSDIVKKIGTFIGGAIGASLIIGFLRTKNIFKLDDIIKSMSARYNSTIDKLTRRRLVMSKDDVDGFLEYLSTNNFKEQHDALIKVLEQTRSHGAMTGQSPVVRRYIPKKELNPNGMYYDLGFIESKGAKTAVNVITYPINLVTRLVSKGNELIKNLFVKNSKPIDAKSEEVTMETAVAFIHKYTNRYREAISKDDMYPFKKELEDAFTRHFSEANSQNKNTTIAMLSRIIITIFGGYFLANDARNEVLIESKGKDVERANVTAKEKVGQKIANFFFNSMLMDIFNTTFENIYLGSVVGATAVAMATEVTNETAVRASIGTPTKKMTKEEIVEYEQKRLNSPGVAGAWCRWFMKVTGKKPISEKAKQ